MADFQSRWMFIILPSNDKGTNFDHVTNEQYLARCKEFVGDDSIPIESKPIILTSRPLFHIQRFTMATQDLTSCPVINVSKWYINEIIAEYYSDGNM